MNKTINEMAKECDVSKQKVYRFIKKNAFSEVHHDTLRDTPKKNQVRYYDETVQEAVYKEFFKKEADEKAHQDSHHEVHQNTSDDILLNQIDFLQKQLEIKDKQIQELHILLNQAQSKSEIEYKPNKQEKSNEHQGFWKRIFKSLREQ